MKLTKKQKQLYDRIFEKGDYKSMSVYGKGKSKVYISEILKMIKSFETNDDLPKNGCSIHRAARNSLRSELTPKKHPT